MTTFHTAQILLTSKQGNPKYKLYLKLMFRFRHSSNLKFLKIHLVAAVIIFYFTSCQHTPYNITSEYVSINGYENYIEYYIQKNDNPITLVIHGGPGTPYQSAFHLFDPSILEHTNVVLWHQKNAGNSFINSTTWSDVSLASLVDDGIQIVNFLKNKFNKKNIYLLGHSWGTVLSLELVQRIPESIIKYFSISQVVSIRRSNENAMDWLSEAICYYRPYMGIDEYEYVEGLKLKEFLSKDEVSELYNMRSSYANHILEVYYNYQDSIYPLTLNKEVEALWKHAGHLTLNQLWNEVQEVSFSNVDTIDIPIVFFASAWDYRTPSILIEDLYHCITSPSKKIFLFERSLHEPYKDDPAKFTSIFKNELAERAQEPLRHKVNY